ncbi:MAG: LexA family transcriptional regulator [Cryomorphaceae bacterium]|nr:LexA family transcriptional regulator [Cryomorphaceae bacterium]
MNEHYLSQNLKLLRKRKGWSQDELAQRYGLSRSALSAYEIGSAEPGIATLIRLSEDFLLPIDDLIKRDLNALSQSELDMVAGGLRNDVTGKHLRVLATTVNADEEEQIALVPERAKAGYTGGYADPDFLSELPHIHLPFLSKHKTYRAFHIHGDSMPPIQEGSIVVGAYVDDWTSIKENERYIVVSRHEGIVLKYISGDWQKTGAFILSSSNPTYAPYPLAVNDILEIWQFAYHISDGSDALENGDWNDAFRQIKAELNELRRMINKP